MRIFTAVWLPAITGTKRIKKEGDTVVDVSGNHFVIQDEHSGLMMSDAYRRAQLCLVYEEHNLQHILGIVSTEAKWVKAGDEIRGENTRQVGKSLIYSIKCQCGKFH